MNITHALADFYRENLNPSIPLPQKPRPYQRKMFIEPEPAPPVKRFKFKKCRVETCKLIYCKFCGENEACDIMMSIGMLALSALTLSLGFANYVIRLKME